MLSYSPKRETIERKLKQLPVKHLRVFTDNEEEFKLMYGVAEVHRSELSTRR
nr:unnamed protein product [Callosobruchus analis]